jgi:hypothetical protein
MFFSFLAVFPLPESYQNDPKFHFNTLLRSDTQKSSKNVENTTVFWSRCETVFGPPAKADIATAILTNVIEHLVLLLPPNKHAFTAKAVWADLYQSYFRIFKKHLLPNRLGKVAVQPISLATQEAQGPTTPVNLHLNLILSSKITVANSSCCRSSSKLFHLRRIAFLKPL